MNHVLKFLDAGVDLFIGTDDPGFLGNTFDHEVELVRDIVKQHEQGISDSKVTS